jgi:hypothetical protein
MMNERQKHMSNDQLTFSLANSKNHLILVLPNRPEKIPQVINLTILQHQSSGLYPKYRRTIELAIKPIKSAWIVVSIFDV